MKKNIEKCMDVLIANTALLVVLFAVITITLYKLTDGSTAGLAVISSLFAVLANIINSHRERIKAADGLLSSEESERKKINQAAITKRTWLILYLVFYIWLNFHDLFDLSSPVIVPLWLNILEYICESVAVIFILLYIIRKRPNSLDLFFKIFIPILVLSELYGLYYVFSYISQDTKDPMWINFLSTVIVIILNLPAWYLCFRFGYIKNIQNQESTI